MELWNGCPNTHVLNSNQRLLMKHTSTPCALVTITGQVFKRKAVRHSYEEHSSLFTCSFTILPSQKRYKKRYELWRLSDF